MCIMCIILLRMDYDDMYDSDMMEEYYNEYAQSNNINFDPGPPRISRISLARLYSQCARPTLLHGPLPSIATYLFCCLFTNIIGRIAILSRFRPLVSVVVGLWMCVKMFDLYLTTFLFVMAFSVAFVRALSIKFELRPFTDILFCIMLMLFCQNVFPSIQFNRIRGPLMIIVMKGISLSMDSIITHSQSVFQDVLLILCYLLDIGSIIFGPWISYANYTKTLVGDKATKMSTSANIFRTVTCIVAAFACLLYSSCFIDWLLPDELQYYSNWIIAFRDAQSFRFSHYFISLISEASSRLSGINFEGFLVTGLHAIEFPRSLVDVVINWNVPMHTWLKNYVFLPVKMSDGSVAAIWATYFASASLHGFNFQLAAVLISLGFYTYVEHELRHKLCYAFDACVAAKRCKQCDHTYKYWNPFVMLLNISFFVLSVFHLAYLGSVFNADETAEEGYSMQHTLVKWSALGFSSHYIAMAMFVFCKII